MSAAGILVRIALLGGVGLVAWGCGGVDGAEQGSERVRLTAPAVIAAADELVFCSDIAYPPVEFMQGDEPAGSDIEIGRELAKRLGVEATFRNTGFDVILDDLAAKRCDAVISSLTNTAERRAKVRFVDYARWGQSLMVPTANPRDISGLADLGGARVAVQSGTVNEEFLAARAASNPGDAPQIEAFGKDTEAVAALKAGEVDAYFGDSPVVAYYIGEEALTYAFAGRPVNAEPIGIAVRPADADLDRQLTRGIQSMYADGAMRRILERWKLDDFALPEL